jgi:hypothetical protein
MSKFVNHLMAPSLMSGATWDNLAGHLDNVSPMRGPSPPLRSFSLADSIQRIGLLHAIGVCYMTEKERTARDDECTIALLYGAHRLEAHKLLRLAAERSGDEQEIDRWGCDAGGYLSRENGRGLGSGTRNR